MTTRHTVAAIMFIVVAAGLVAAPSAQSSRAHVSEAVRQIPTYPFSEPNPVPVLARDTRLYPYFTFEGYAHESTPRPWKVVTLENDWIEVLVLPELGGKIWGARVKKTGHDFIYRNESIKFRNVALRGPWTSGGIEFNFGVVGHTPSTATPVDYALRDNPDGSVSCIVGTMDLPSRTEWRVEIRLPANKAAFETHVLWHNPTTLEQPYYNWMTAAAFAKDDLTMAIPGNAYLDHPGPRHDWPIDEAGRFLPGYRNNQFGSNKSFHVVGELQDVFGGYFANAGWGFGHWARHEEMPGQKLWLWALSRAGGIWEDLLTDKNGQYVEYQAGRLLVQYTPGSEQTPIRQAGFDPMATDRWTETWFPLEGIGGLTEASANAALSVTEAGDRLKIGVNSFVQADAMVKVWLSDRLALERPVSFKPLEPVIVEVPRPETTTYRIEVAGLGVSYTSEPATRRLSRPFDGDTAATRAIPETDRLVFEAKELVQARRYELAWPLLEKALAQNGWHHDGLLAMADLEYRRARYAEGLERVTRVLKLDTYDAAANMTAANLYRALGQTADARDSYGWAARSLTYRAAANTALAELALARADWAEASHYARTALDYNRLNLTAWEVVAIAGRKTGDSAMAREAARELLALDPLHHSVAAEAYLAAPSSAGRDAFLSGLRSELPDESILEIVASYANRGLKADAIALLDGATPRMKNPLIRAWLAYLENDRARLTEPADIALVFPYRLETLPVLTWAARGNPHWSWTYLLALELWGFDRQAEALALLTPLGQTPTAAAFYVTRGTLLGRAGANPEADLLRATALAGGERPLHLPLIEWYQAKGRWADALAASTDARGRFPGDFNLDIMHVRSLVHLGRATDALAILDRVRVLPSEGARESHQLYVQAHALAALTNIGSGELDAATVHLNAALEWPEHLGQGKPYDPDERLIRFIMAVLADRQSRKGTAVGASSPSQTVAALARALTSGSATGQPGAGDAGLSGDVDAALVRRALELIR